MTRVIAVVSGKGGVGKTTVVSNVGTALSHMGDSVLLIDGNVTGANLALHLGMNPVDPVSLNDVLSGRAYLPQAVYKHPSGLAVVPASLFDPNANLDGLKKYIYTMMGAKDFIFIDAAAGVCDETRAAIEAADEVLVVTNPDLPSVTHSMTAKTVADALGRPVIGVVVNMKRGEKHELSEKEVGELMGAPVIHSIPEHRTVREATSKRSPVVSENRYSPASRAFDGLAKKLSGRPAPKERLGLISKILSRL